jgi:hypothetical protein
MWDRRWQQRKGTRRTRPRMLLQDSANGSRGFVGVFLVRLRHPPWGARLSFARTARQAQELTERIS